MPDRQIITNPGTLSELLVGQLEASTSILLALISASSFQNTNLLRPETIDQVLDAYEKIYCRVNKTVCSNINCLR